METKRKLIGVTSLLVVIATAVAFGALLCKSTPHPATSAERSTIQSALSKYEDTMGREPSAVQGADIHVDGRKALAQYRATIKGGKGFKPVEITLRRRGGAWQAVSESFDMGRYERESAAPQKVSR
jgi:hypothetical protein